MTRPLSMECAPLSKHAREVMARRGISHDEVDAILADPAQVEPHEGRLRYVRDGIAVVVAPERRPVVVTVLLREHGRWSDEQCRERAS